ncbi:MAG: transglutaminase domain-containing protein, partial [Lachnospiraceae bacterium]|nr:transglutaminase domain-containing protein [Lachnospiraceae bacterium]
MNIYDTRRKWYKNLSLLLVMTLMIGLMSGCGQKNSNNKPADSIDVAAQTKTVHSKSDAIVTKDEELASSMDALEDIISNSETAKANEIVQDIVDIIDTENNDIAEWLEAQNKVSESLSEEAKATYNERLATFEASIKEKQDKTSSIIASLTDAINNNEVDNIEAYYNELDEIVLHKDDAAVYSVNGERNYKPLNQEIVSFNYINNELDATDVSYLTTAGDAEVDEAIANKADELETPLAIYNYLKNNIGYEYYYGSRKGAKGVLASMNGNDLDQASLLLAMLRYKG